MLLTTIVFFAILGIIVLVHEAGHFVMARKGGIKVDEFGLGLPPRIFGFYKNEQGKWIKVGRKAPVTLNTIWSLNWFPLGGFVKIKGEEGEDSNDPDSFANKSIGRRAVVLSAGVFMNVVLAFVLLTVGLMIGLPQVLDDVDFPKTAKVKNIETKIVDVLPNSPADKAGLVIADSVLSVDGAVLEDVTQFQDFMDGKVGQEVNLSIKRGDEVLAIPVTPEVLAETDRGGMGVALVRIGFVSYPWYIAWWYGLGQTLSMIASIFVGFYLIIQSLVVSQELIGEVYGPIGIATLVGDALDLGFLYVLQFTAVLSIIIAVINYLPFPALDGGRVLFLIIEAIRRKPINQKIEAMMHNAGFALLMALVLVVTYRDIARISGGFFEKILGFF